jgi:hypothetical protein
MEHRKEIHKEDSMNDLFVTSKEQEDKILKQVFKDAEDVAYGRMKTKPISELLKKMDIWQREIEREVEEDE